MVSVIIPTHNRGGYVREAVASVLGQTVSPMEVIVVDDGSTDDTAVALAQFGTKIRYVRREHGGVSAARNTGIERATGEWLAFLDSDDLWLPRKLASQIDYHRRHPSILISQTEEIWMRDGKRVNPRKYHKKPEGHCFEDLLERCLISPSAVMMHRDLLHEVGLFDESLPACEDYDLWLRIGFMHAIGLVDKHLIIKRGGHPGQLSSSIPALDRYRIRSLANLIQKESLSPAQRKAALDVLRRKCRIYAAGCAKRGKAGEAEQVMALPQSIAVKIGSHVTT